MEFDVLPLLVLRFLAIQVEDAAQRNAFPGACCLVLVSSNRRSSKIRSDTCDDPEAGQSVD